MAIRLKYLERMGAQGSDRIFLKLLWLAFIVHGRIVWGQENEVDYGTYGGMGQENHNQTGYNYNYKSYYYDYGGVEGTDQNCYSCTFHVRAGNAAGLDYCRDPFIQEVIPVVPCKGYCAKIYHKTNPTEYTVTRICVPNCKEAQDEKGYTQCCMGDLCNGAPGCGFKIGLYFFISIVICIFMSFC